MPFTPTPKRTHALVVRTFLIFAFGLTAQILLPERLLNLLRPTVRAASIFTVDSLADTPDALAGNGLCADSSGNCTLRAAIQEANSFAGDDTINFNVTGTINLTGVLPDIASNMSIKGPGSALLTVRRDTGGEYRIFSTNNRNVTLSGMTITNGKTADGVPGTSTGGSAQDGGGIRQSGGVLILTDLVITGNRTGNGGPATGGSTSFGGDGGEGGGLSSLGTLTMTNCVVSNNVTGNGGTGAYGHTGGRGGGIFLATGASTLTNVSVTGNRTGDGGVGINSGYSGGNSGSGGGIYSSSPTLNMTNVNISNNIIGNTTRGDSGLGGGIMIYSGTAKLINSTVSNNLTGSATVSPGRGGLGGGIANFGTLTVMGSAINGNATGTSQPVDSTAGGGIYNNFILTLINTTVSGNILGGTGGSGGGLVTSTPATIINSTVTANQAPSGTGGGIYGTDRTIVRNSIIAGNSAQNSPDVKGTLSSQGHNLIGIADGTNGFTNGVSGDQVGLLGSPLDPKLGPLAWNGGPTQTHALLAGSPALDAGNNSLAKDANDNVLTTDQRGAGRFANSAGSGQPATVDVGAFEFHPSGEDISDKTINEDAELLISFSIGDVTANARSLTASSSDQTLVPDSNIFITGDGSVRTLRVKPAADRTGTALITLTVTEAGGPISSSTFMLTVSEVNDAPTFTPSDQIVNEDSGAQTTTNWATDISAGTNEPGQALTFLITGNTNAALFATGPVISNSGTLTYTPAPNAYGSAVVSVVLKDDGGTANGGQDTSATKTFTITVNGVNDVPTFTKGADQTVNEDSFVQSVPNWATSISAGPNESGQQLTFQVTGNTNPTIFAFGPSINSAGTLTYTPSFNHANGSAVITVVLKDNGGTANGGVDTSAAQTFTINVTAVNDAPLIQVPFSQATNQNTPMVFSTATSNPISVTDVDAGSDPLRLTLSAPNGTLTLGGMIGLTFITGDGTDDATMTFTGTTVNLNAALNGLTFKPNTGFSGSTHIQLTIDDQGYNGSGGAKSHITSLLINVRSGGVLQFNLTTYSASEAASTAVITVFRTGGSAGSASVSFASANGTASGGAACAPGIDYVNTSGTLSWVNNETGTKSFTIPICPDSFNEPNETINLVLSNPTGTGALGARTAATLTITNDDLPVLLTEENSDRAIALDSVTLTRDPFSLFHEFNLSADRRRRVSLFVWRLGLLPTDTAANISVLAEDNQGTPYPLTVESIGSVLGLDDVTQIIVVLPESVGGIPRDLWVKVTLRGPSSNRGIIKIAGP